MSIFCASSQELLGTLELDVDAVSAVVHATSGSVPQGSKPGGIMPRRRIDSRRVGISFATKARGRRSEVSGVKGSILMPCAYLRQVSHMKDEGCKSTQEARNEEQTTGGVLYTRFCVCDAGRCLV